MNKRSNPLIRACKKKELDAHLAAYLEACADTDAPAAKGQKKLPNLAGFCRSMECGPHAFSQLCELYPDAADRILAALEDEVLNHAPSPTLLAAYLKRRLGYADKIKAEENETEASCGLMRLVFEHDIEEDGE